MDQKEKKIMVGIGEILWDMLPDGRQLGGAPANFAYHVTQLGNSGVIVSAVGSDDDGTDILQTLEEKNVRHLITTTKQYPTGTVTVSMGDKGVPSYIIHEDVAWDHLQLNDHHLELAAKADVVCFGTLAQRFDESAEAIRSFLQRTANDCIRLFDINLRQSYYDRKTVMDLLQLSTILKLNDEELLVIKDFLGITGRESEILGKLCSSCALDLIILTKGEKGSRLFSPRLGDSSYKGEVANVVDTVGAGDSFAAAVATGLCLDMSLGEIHPFADKVAAFVCGHAGATPKLPPLAELL